MQTKEISLILYRLKTKTHEVKFRSPQLPAPVGFLYLRKSEDARLGMPRAIRVTVEAAEPTPEAASAAIRDEDHVAIPQ